VKYKVGENFSHLPMPEDSPFKCSWWFRTEFKGAGEGSRASLRFDGINYRANIWVNGKKIADAKDVAGAYRSYVFDITAVANGGKPNALAVEVFPPTPTDLAINWVDWNPMPPDKEMGLWKDVVLLTGGAVAIRHPYVASALDPTFKSAALTLHADLVNLSSEPVKGVLKASVGDLRLQRNVTLAAGETKHVTFAPEEFAELKIANPRLWWPRDFGKPELYDLSLAFDVDGNAQRSQMDAALRHPQDRPRRSRRAGRVYRVNGEKILIRGGGWSGDALMRYSPARMETEFKYVKDMGLNTIRLEGKLEREEFFEQADREGILVMAGWCCCDIWEEWQKWTAETRAVAKASLHDQIQRLRTHPSLLVWLNGSDNPPPADVESMYIDVLKKDLWPNPYISSAANKPTTVTGPSGVKMTGPYDYVPPNYWLLGASVEHGGAFGFNSETSAGPAIPTRQSLELMLGKDHLWPYDEVWTQHAGGGHFVKLDLYDNAMDKRYGKAADLDDYERKSQAIAYEGERAMFEAFNRNKFTSTGVIQWMLNNGWPSTIWHLYDYNLVPGGGYYGARTALQPVHAQYSYDDRSIVITNSTLKAAPGLRLTVQVLNFDLTEKFAKSITVEAKANASARVLTLPEIAGLSKTYFLRLTLVDKTGSPMGSNFYWLSTAPDVLDWKKSDWAMTPQTAFADMNALKTLPEASLTVSPSMVAGTGITVTVTNAGKSLAFMVHVRLTDAKGADVVPALWSDNYITLLPGETRMLTAEVDPTTLKTAKSMAIDGWNVKPAEHELK
jgi:exo-1,4-beta-D-glucosaminidase